MRIAWFEPYSGASGEMLLGALVDSGFPAADLRAYLARAGLSGFDLRINHATQNGLAGTRVQVLAHDDTPIDIAVFRARMQQAAIPETVCAASLAVHAALADAESRTRGDAVEPQSSAANTLTSLVAIVGVAAGLHMLGIERVYSDPPALGHGMAQTRDGMVPIPSPTTARLLAVAGAPSRAADVEAELLTPTAAAILTTLAEFKRPALRTTSVGYGLGLRDLPWPDALRLWIGEDVHESEVTPERPVNADAVLQLEATLGDMNPAYLPLLVERLVAAGASDVTLVPATHMFGQPASIVRAIISSAHRTAVEDVLFDNTTTYEVRVSAVEVTRAGYGRELVTTRWGDVHVNLRIWRGRVLEAIPDYADCLAVARQSDAPLRLIYGEAQRAGDVFVGQRRLPNR